MAKSIAALSVWANVGFCPLTIILILENASSIGLHCGEWVQSGKKGEVIKRYQKGMKGVFATKIGLSFDCFNDATGLSQKI